MAQRTIVYWRDIPAQVIVKAGRKAAKRELPERFVTAIDKCAMSVGAHDTDAYLNEWRRGEPEPCGDNLEEEAEASRVKLEADYSNERLAALIRAGGFEDGVSTDGLDRSHGEAGA